MGKKKSKLRKDQIEQLWTRLVESAFDFFEQAVEEYADLPKYAILHLATSVELFIKARLMIEHWTLLGNTGKPFSFERLTKGDFESIGFKGLFSRIEDVLHADQCIDKHAQSEFVALADDRNKVVHFFHSDVSKAITEKTILQRQCRVWLYLHRLLSENWKDVFTPFEKRLSKLDRTMRKKQGFLNEVFNASKNAIHIHRKAGKIVIPCPSCNYDAMMISNNEAFTSGKCVVCKYYSNLLHVNCSECNEMVFLESGNNACPKCGFQFESELIADLIGCEHLDGDRKSSPTPVWCEYCNQDEVYAYKNGYICLNCLEEHDEVTMCEWCSEYSTGSRNDTYWLGCLVCDGHAGYHQDRD